MKTAQSLNFKRIGTITLIWDLAVKLKLFKVRGYEPYSTKEVKKEHKGKSKADEETAAAEEEHEASVPLVTYVNNIFHSMFPKVEVHINNKQNYKSN